MIVVDASVLIGALLDDGSAGDTARTALSLDPEWAGPPHLLIETVSVTRRRTLRGEVSTGRAQEAVTALGELEIHWVDPQRLLPRIWELRDTVTAFDAAYVAAAEMLDCVLLTEDRKLASASGPRCPIRVPSAG